MGCVDGMTTWRRRWRWDRAADESERVCLFLPARAMWIAFRWDTYVDVI
jgi:hypothetical protein